MPTAGCQISNLIFEENNCGGGFLLISHEKYIMDGKVLVHLGFKSKVFPVILTALSAWVVLCSGGFCTSMPTAGCQISKLIFEKKLWRGISMNIL
jgi:hypothetical protein